MYCMYYTTYMLDGENKTKQDRTKPVECRRKRKQLRFDLSNPVSRQKAKGRCEDGGWRMDDGWTDRSTWLSWVPSPVLSGWVWLG